jgi:hypothetical protein
MEGMEWRRSLSRACQKQPQIPRSAYPTAWGPKHADSRDDTARVMTRQRCVRPSLGAGLFGVDGEGGAEGVFFAGGEGDGGG